VSVEEDFYAKTDRTCQRGGCGKPAELTPVIELMPPKSSGYKGAPIKMRYGFAICEGCRPWFLETSAALIFQAEGLARTAGQWVDSKRTQLTLIALPDKKAGK